MKLAETIKRLRRARGWTQEGLAVAAGLSSGTVNRLEGGHGYRSETIERLEGALGVELEVSVEESGPVAESA